MSEKIVQLNEEVIKGQLKELVRGSVEETLNELLEAEPENLTQAARNERNEQRQGYRGGATTTATSPLLPGMSLSRCPKASLLRPPSLSGIAAGRAVWKRLSLKCTWQVYSSGV